ncbi:TetR/AcrR family transcriptional regulator [Nonomuraea thailandensis]
MGMTARRRQVEVDQAILEAAYGELLDRGYAGVTYDGVARRAETSKPVLYRRYPTRASLIFASSGAASGRCSRRRPPATSEATSLPGWMPPRPVPPRSAEGPIEPCWARPTMTSSMPSAR